MSKDTIKELKTSYVDYFVDCPVQRYGAMYIGRDEDTIIRWKKEDQDFADAVQRAKADWIRKKFMTTKSEFALEKLEKSVFGPNGSLEDQEKEVKAKKLSSEVVNDFAKYIRNKDEINLILEDKDLPDNVKAWQVIE